MKKSVLSVILTLLTFGIFAQQIGDLHPCGTPSYRSKWLKEYQANPAVYETKDDEILYVPLTIHLLGWDNGTGYFSVPRLLDALCTLNEDFIEADMQFYIQGDFNYIANTAWNVHATVQEGAEMMFANNVENTINCYIVADPAGNCGYNLPYAGMAVAKSCADPADHTWAHEMGHQLALPHPFIGWEGGHSYDGQAISNFSEPAPDTVYIDYTYFQSYYVPIDTLIIDTLLTERLDGSNCTEAADGFCDTAPDYLAYRWNCNSEAESNVIQRDPNDETFRSDGTLIMSYANDACSYRFSPDQIAAMRANVIDEKPELIAENQMPGEEIGEVVLSYPVDSVGVGSSGGVLFDWEDTPGATGYVITVDAVLGSTGVTIKRLESDVSEVFMPDDLIMGQTYRWTVRAYSGHYFCNEYYAEGLFYGQTILNTEEFIGLTKLTVQPNILTQGTSQLTVNAEILTDRNLSWTLTDLAGRTTGTGVLVTNGADSFSQRIEVENLLPGVYFFGISDGTAAAYRRIVVY